MKTKLIAAAVIGIGIALAAPLAGWLIANGHVCWLIALLALWVAGAGLVYDAIRERTEMKTKTLHFDVMLHGRYVCTMHYRYCPLWAIDMGELHDFVVSERPGLKNKPFNIEF